MRIKTKDMALSALLSALSILFPIVFQFVTVPLGPFTATFASHVPVIAAMFISPLVAVMAGVGSVIGFMLRGMPIWIVARAAMHIPFALLGAYMVKKKVNPLIVCLATLVVHSCLEFFAVLPFLEMMNMAGKLDPSNAFGLTLDWGTVIIVGTAIHHLIDFAIAESILVPLRAAGWISKDSMLLRKKKDDAGKSR